MNWRAESLGRLNRAPNDELKKSFPGCYYRDADYCVLDDEESKGTATESTLTYSVANAITDGEYVDLTLNPERFTGYAGPAATRVWSAIYEENCFGLSEDDFQANDLDADLLTTSPSGFSPLGLSPLIRQAQEAEKETCLEKRIYYRIVSGAARIGLSKLDALFF